MRQLREVLRLYFESHLAPRQIGTICKVSKSTVQRYLERLKAAGLSWPLPADLDDVALERRLFPPPPVASPEERCLPDCAAIHRELKSRKNVTLQLLWEEYKQANPLGYAYSWYCELYREWQRRLDVVLRHEHRAGEKAFVDYAGQTVPVIDPKTGEVRQAQVFVAVLGASNYTYAEATWTQNLWDWIHSHVRAFEFFDGTSQLVIPDNLKSGVTKPCYYEPELNRTYGDLAIHYGVAILPARPYRPRDKAKAEVGVQIVQRWVLAALRKRQFFSLADLNEAMHEHQTHDGQVAGGVEAGPEARHFIDGERHNVELGLPHTQPAYRHAWTAKAHRLALQECLLKPMRDLAWSIRERVAKGAINVGKTLVDAGCRGPRLQAGLEPHVVQQSRLGKICHRYLGGVMDALPPANEVQQVVSVTLSKPACRNAA